MKTAIDAIVIACMFVALYINWTDFPKLVYAREVRGLLEKNLK
jgi:hypothetical protein